MKFKHLFSQTFGLLFFITFFSEAQERLLIIREDGIDFKNAAAGLTSELAEEFGIYQLKVENQSTIEDIHTKIANIVPKIVVLMGTNSIKLFRKYSASAPDTIKNIPSIALLASNLDQEMSSLPNATGILMEVPIVTAVVNLRSIIDMPISKVGVIYRPAMKDFVERNVKFCEREQIKLIPYEITNPSHNVKVSLKKSVKNLTEKEQVQVIWIANDPTFLSSAVVKTVWEPLAQKKRIPIIVGDDKYVTDKNDFGTLSIRPDFVAYGIQAAQLVLDIADNDWVIEDKKAQLPLSIFKVINCSQVQNNYKTKYSSLMSLDGAVCFGKEKD